MADEEQVPPVPSPEVRPDPPPAVADPTPGVPDGPPEAADMPGSRPVRRPPLRLVGIVAAVALTLFLGYWLLAWNAGGRFSPGTDSLLRPVLTLADNLLGDLFPDSTRAVSPVPPPDSTAGLAEPGAGVATVPPVPPNPPLTSGRPVGRTGRAPETDRTLAPARRPPSPTAADLQRRRRGEVTAAAPTRTDSVDSAAIRSRRSMARIREVLEIAMVGVQSDIALQRGINPGLAGEVSVRLTIAPDGSIQSVDPVRNTTGNPQLPQRIIRRLQRLRFPPTPTGLPIVLTLPFTIAE